MIHLRAQNWSSIGDDTFWCWANREFPESVPADTQPVGASDHVLHYGLLGAPAKNPEQTVALLWEQHPEMAREVGHLCGNSWGAEIALLHAAAAACPRRTVASAILVDDFRHHGPVDVLPLAVDTDLWKPLEHGRREARERHGIPQDARLGFWGGTGHPMKGWDLLLEYAQNHPDVWWVTVFKQKRMPHSLRGVTVTQVPQSYMAELMGMSDFALFTSRLRPYSMTEWEAMSCNLPIINVGHPNREFTPSADPRHDVFSRGWDRHTAKATWLEYLGIL